eukprot:TRINITY_DN8367_c0_g1_i2.p1 TRINITY_DN8367_c0_g1~~TRINITY_DN8367_c0_g1_i2.p1  ORF type:complete len:229 (+),score=58.96 TRINITY_DN8367_c0_g1_i2:141-827(+)
MCIRDSTCTEPPRLAKSVLASGLSPRCRLELESEQWYHESASLYRYEALVDSCTPSQVRDAAEGLAGWLSRYSNHSQQIECPPAMFDSIRQTQQLLAATRALIRDRHLDPTASASAESFMAQSKHRLDAAMAAAQAHGCTSVEGGTARWLCPDGTGGSTGRLAVTLHESESRIEVHANLPSTNSSRCASDFLQQLVARVGNGLWHLARRNLARLQVCLLYTSPSPRDS